MLSWSMEPAPPAPETEDLEPTEHRTATINLTPAHIVTLVTLHLQTVSDNLALGLSSIDAFTFDVIPDLSTKGVPYSVHPRSEMTDADRAASKEKFKLWLLSAAFRDMVKALTLAVEEALFLIEVASWEFGKPTRGDEIQEKFEKARRRATAGDFPQRVKKLRDLIHPFEMPRFEHVLSINTTRACLEHRGGVVDPKDTVNDRAWGALILKFLKISMYAMENGRMVDVMKERGHWFMGGMQPALDEERRVFEVGRTVSLTTDDLNWVMYTCQQFAYDLHQGLEHWMLQRAEKIGAKVIYKDPPWARGENSEATV